MNPALRVLLMAWNYPPAVGGIESVALHLAAGLPRHGHAVFTIARHSPEPERDPAVVRPGRPGFLAYQWFSLCSAWRRLRGTGADVIVCAGIVNAPVAWCLARWFGLPWVVLAHGSDVAHGGWVYRLCMRFLFRRATGIPANSRHTQALLESIGCQPARIRVIHPGVDAAHFPLPGADEVKALQARHGLEGRRVLLSAGRLIRRKGIAEFVEHVMPGLVRRFPNLVYVVAGGDATASLVHSERLLDTLRQRVGALGLGEHVRLPGNVSDTHLRELYAVADLFVLPAIPVRGDVEGFGIVFLEAALAQTPAVATRLGGIPDAVEPGQGGLLVEAGDWDGLARAITGLLEDDARLAALGVSARQRVLDHFTWPRIVGQYAAYLGELVARAPGRSGSG